MLRFKSEVTPLFIDREIFDPHRVWSAEPAKHPALSPPTSYQMTHIEQDVSLDRFMLLRLADARRAIQLGACHAACTLRWASSAPCAGKKDVALVTVLAMLRLLQAQRQEQRRSMLSAMRYAHMHSTEL